MRKFNAARLLLPAALLIALAHAASAQTAVDERAALSTFPDSQAVLFVNARRVVNDVLPRVMTPADYRKMLAESQKVGFDVRGLQYAAVGVRFNADAPAGTPPDFVVVVKGNFNADSLLMLARIGMAAQNVQSREESYGSKSIEVISTDAVERMMGKGGGGKPEGADGEAPRPKPFPYPELAFTALDSNTLVAGVPAFVRSAVDAAGGQGRLKPSMIGLAAQDANAIWSLTAELPPDLAGMAHRYGAPANQQFDQMVGWVKQLNVSQGMTALDYTLNVAVLTDQPEHASAFSGLIRMGQAFAENALREAASKEKGKDAARAREGLAVLSTAVNRTEGSTLILRVSVPQKAVADLIKDKRGKAPTTTTRRRTRRPARRR
jgi:hypothetical protein